MADKSGLGWEDDNPRIVWLGDWALSIDILESSGKPLVECLVVLDPVFAPIVVLVGIFRPELIGYEMVGRFGCVEKFAPFDRKFPKPEG